MPSMSGWANSRTRGVAGQNSQNSSIFPGTSPCCKIAPEMILDARPRRALRRLPMEVTCAQISASDLAISTAARAASVPRLISFSEAAFRACSSFSKLRTALNHRNAMFERDLLQRIGHGPGRGVARERSRPCRITPIARIASAFFFGAPSPGPRLGFQKRRERDARATLTRGESRRNSSVRMTDQALHIFGVELARDDREIALGRATGAASGNELRWTWVRNDE